MNRDEELFTYIKINFPILGNGFVINSDARFKRNEVITMYVNTKNEDTITLACGIMGAVKYFCNGVDYELFYRLIDMAEYLTLYRQYHVEPDKILDFGALDYFKKKAMRDCLEQERLAKEAGEVPNIDFPNLSLLRYRPDVIKIDDEVIEGDTITNETLQMVLERLKHLTYSRIEITTHNYMEYKKRKLLSSETSFVVLRDQLRTAIYYFNGENLHINYIYENRKGAGDIDGYEQALVDFRGKQIGEQVAVVSRKIAPAMYCNLLMGKNLEDWKSGHSLVFTDYYHNKQKYMEIRQNWGEF